MKTSILAVVGLMVAGAVAVGACGSGGGAGGSAASSTSGESGASTGTGGTTHPPTGSFGAECVKNGDCASSLCLPIDGHDICTKPCASAADCPAALPWSCGEVAGAGDLCLCMRNGPEVCDGQDNDCDGLVDNGASCPEGTLCVSGSCSCPDQFKCGNACIDTTTDPHNCGGCGKACGASMSCVGGACGCDSGFELCGGQCISVSQDQKNCGACGNVCPASTTCSGGKCLCAGGLVSCGGVCLDLSGDPANCGACGRDCQGSACTAGECAPIVLFADDFTRSLAVDATDVYFISKTPGVPAKCPIQKMPKGGGAPTKLGDAFLPSDLTLTGSKVYWVDGSANGYYSAPKAGGAVTGLGFGGDVGYSGIVVDTTYLFAVGSTQGDVWRAKVGTSSAVDTGALANPEAGGFVVIEPGTPFPPLYWTTSTALHGDHLTGGAAQMTVPATGGTPRHLAIDAVNVYWVEGGNAQGNVRKVARSGLGMPVDLATGQNNPTGIAIDAKFVYWTNTGDGTVSRVPINGGSVTVIATGQTHPSDLVTDGTSLFWGNNYAGGAVMRMTK